MINDAELFRRLNDHEDNFVERKSQGIKADEIRQTVCAFANSLVGDGIGILFIGLHDKTGMVEGVENSDSVQKRVREACERGCYPPITNFICRVLKPEGKPVVAVVIGSSNERPHFSGPAYIRRGSESVNATPEIYGELIASRNEKAGRILNMRGKVVSILAEGRMIINPLPVPNLRDKGEGKITYCDAHVVRFDLLSGSFPLTELAESIDVVSVSFDTQNRRDMLIIRSVR
ncbi:MAG TPA: ATP-binding protein [Noviherbaspirillum sp.]